jgi:thiamine-phosphate pyrophosphorylase
MAARGKVTTRPAPRLYLALAVTDDTRADAAQALGKTLTELVLAADIAAVLLRNNAADPRALKTIISAVQTAGAALLIDGDIAAAQRLGADGVHVNDPAALKSTLESVKPDGIVGAGGLHSRHDAMIAGESGADYVLFGEPEADGMRPSTEAIVERIGWWAELFEPPCVAYADTLDDARNFATAGADFVLVDNLVWNDARGARAALMDVAQAIRQHA